MAKSFIDHTDVNGTVKYFDAWAIAGNLVDASSFEDSISLSDYYYTDFIKLEVYSSLTAPAVRIADKAIYTVNYRLTYKEGWSSDHQTTAEHVLVFSGTATDKLVDTVGFKISIEYLNSYEAIVKIGNWSTRLSLTTASQTQTGVMTLISDLSVNPFEVIKVSGSDTGPSATAQDAIDNTGYTGYAGYSMYNGTTNAIFVGPNYFGGGKCVARGSAGSSDFRFDCTGTIYKF